MSSSFFGRTWLVAWALSGCSAVPVAINHRISTQSNLQSASHWQTLAVSSAGLIVNDLCDPSAGHGCDNQSTPRLHVRPAAYRSPFNQAFERFLASALFDKCRATQIRASRCAISAASRRAPDPDCSGEVSTKCVNRLESEIDIRYGVQRVVHRDTSVDHPPPLLFTLLGAGVWLGHHAATYWSKRDDFHAAIPAGLALDLLAGAIAAPTHTEVIVSVLATHPNGDVVFRNDSIYYVNDADGDEYPNSPLDDLVVYSSAPAVQVSLSR
jgi:hypothetical protein